MKIEWKEIKDKEQGKKDVIKSAIGGVFVAVFLMVISWLVTNNIHGLVGVGVGIITFYLLLLNYGFWGFEERLVCVKCGDYFYRDELKEVYKFPMEYTCGLCKNCYKRERKKK